MRRIMGWLFGFLPDATKDSLRVASVRSRLSAARVTPIAKVEEGAIVVVAATLVSGISEPLVAPMSGRQCVYWEVRTQRDLALHQDYANPFTHDHDAQDFFIEDDTGRALVLPTNYVVSIHPDVERTAESNGYVPTRARIWKLPAGQPVRETRHEGVLQPGSRLLVRGQCFWEPDPNPRAMDALYRAHAMRLRVSAPPGEQLMIAAAPDTSAPGDAKGAL